MKHASVALLPFCLTVSGCGSTLPLVFVDKTSVGIGVSTDTGGLEVSVGFDTKSAAIVPVAVRQKDKDGSITSIVQLQAESAGVKDAYSTFGNFSSDTKGDGRNVSASVGLGRFFATGMAAQKIADKVGESMVEKAKK